MKILKIVLLLALIASLGLWILIYFGPFQLKNPSYLFWVHFGEECPKEYFDNYVFVDLAKSRIIYGLSEEKIRKRFPLLFDGEIYPKDSTRGKVLETYKTTEFKDKNVKILWFDDNPQWLGWVIVLVDGKGVRIDPKKS